MTPDLVNALFEGIGAAFTWMNVRQIFRDKGYAGFYLPSGLFFWSWGMWNLYYYPHLGQWWSFAAGCALVSANAAWLGGMLYFGKKK